MLNSFILNKALACGVKFNFAVCFNSVFQVTYVLLRLGTLEMPFEKALMLSKREKNMLFCLFRVFIEKENPGKKECRKLLEKKKVKQK